MQTISFELEDDIYDVFARIAAQNDMTAEELARSTIMVTVKFTAMGIANPEGLADLGDSPFLRMMVESGARTLENVRQEGRTGWGIASGSGQLDTYHYFRGGRSLCDKYEDHGCVKLWPTWDLVNELLAMGTRLTDRACQDCHTIP